MNNPRNLSFLFAVLAGCLLCLSSAENLLKSRVIVVVDSSSYQSTHSTFFNDLISKGYQLDFRSINSPLIKLMNYGEYSYDHMIIFATTPMDGKGLTKNKIEEFFDSGRNVFIATDVDASKGIRLLFNEFGFDLNEYGSQVQDHINFGDDHSYVPSTNQIKQTAICPQLSKPILYRGASLSLTPFETHQVYGLLRGEDTTYSAAPAGNSDAHVHMISGTDVVLVGATQGRNNARAILTGSIEMLSNNFYKNENFANREFVSNVLDWAFGLKGILKVGKITHTHKGQTEEIHEIRIKDYLDYSIELLSYNVQTGSWLPYLAEDISLEFIMLDPYVRLLLTRDGNTATYRASFQVPDKHGVFKLSVKYEKPGYTFIHETKKITVRPFKHDEYPRYLEQAYPYYFSTWATILAFIVLVGYFLIHKDEHIDTDKTNENKKTQ